MFRGYLSENHKHMLNTLRPTQSTEKYKQVLNGSGKYWEQKSNLEHTKTRNTP